MFLRNANWLRCCTMCLLVLVVNLAGFWPLVSQSASRGVDLFQRYSETMSATQALDFALQAEFCGELPSDEQPADWDAAPSQPDGKLILLGEAACLPTPLEIMIERPMEAPVPGKLAGLPDTPPPRA